MWRIADLGLERCLHQSRAQLRRARNRCGVALHGVALRIERADDWRQTEITWQVLEPHAGAELIFHLMGAGGEQIGRLVQRHLAAQLGRDIGKAAGAARGDGGDLQHVPAKC